MISLEFHPNFLILAAVSAVIWILYLKYQNSLKVMQDANLACQRQLQDKDMIISGQNKKLATLKITETKLNEQVEELRGRTKEADAQLKFSNDLIEKKDAKISELRRQNCSIDERLAAANATIALKDENLCVLQSQIRSKDEELKVANSRITRTDEKIADLQSLITSRDEQIRDLQKTIGGKDEEILSLNEIVSSLQKKIDDLQHRKQSRKGSPWRPASPIQPRNSGSPAPVQKCYDLKASDADIQTLKSYALNLSKERYDLNDLKKAEEERKKKLYTASSRKSSEDRDIDFAAVALLHAMDLYHGPPSGHHFGSPAAGELLGSAIEERFIVISAFENGVSVLAEVNRLYGRNILHVEAKKFNDTCAEKFKIHVWSPALYATKFRDVIKMPSEMRWARFLFMRDPELRKKFFQWDDIFIREPSTLDKGNFDC